MPVINALSDSYHVCPQLHPDDVADVAACGYVALVCMRPDGESPGQPAWAEVAEQARRHGLAFHFIPALSGAVTLEQAAQLRELLADAGGPVLSYCASGNRCALAWRMAMQSQV